MCRLLAVQSAAPAALDYYMLRAPIPFRSFGDQRNPDGWGLAWYEEGQPQLFKDPRPAPASRLLPLLASEAVSRMLIAHLRKASQGVLRRRNCHPFIHGAWTFAHNGTIRNAAELRLQLRGRYRAAAAGETDSEIYFHAILQAIARRGGDVVAGVRDVVAGLTDFTASNFLLTDGRRLFAYRNCSSRPRYFSLFYRQVRRPARRPPGARLAAHDLRRTPHVAVCSNKLTPGAWREIPLRHLLVVEPDLAVRLIKLH